MNTARPEFGAGKARMRKPVKPAPSKEAANAGRRSNPDKSNEQRLEEAARQLATEGLHEAAVVGRAAAGSKANQIEAEASQDPSDAAPAKKQRKLNPQVAALRRFRRGELITIDATNAKRRAAREERRAERSQKAEQLGELFRPEADRGVRGTDATKAKPRAPTKLPKGPAEGSLSPADKVAPEETKRPKMTDAEQSAEFQRVAREHGAEGDDETFDRLIRNLVKPKSK